VDWLNMWGNFVYQQSRDVTASAIRKAFIDYDGDPRRQTFGSGNEFARDADWRVPLDYLPTTSGGLGLRFSREIGRARLTGGITESYVGERSFLEYAGLKPNLSEPDTVDRQFWIDRESGSWTVKYINPPLVTLDPYWRTDLSVTLAFDERFSVGLNIQNLFNARFEESLGTLAPGRFATVELRYHF
jgi:outer membrane receptor protein involved in Fe transport